MSFTLVYMTIAQKAIVFGSEVVSSFTCVYTGSTPLVLNTMSVVLREWSIAITLLNAEQDWCSLKNDLYKVKCIDVAIVESFQV